MSVTNFQHTRVIVRVDSHVSQSGTSSQSQSIDLSNDVIAISTSKSVKARGRFQLQLVPRRNYLNLLHADDIVNIYVDPGDGKRGFVRLMFGYIDRVERQENVNEQGAIQTRYVVVGSDFQKAIERTSIYFNNYMRAQLDERLIRTATGTNRTKFSNLAGTTLYQQGLTMYGSPADFVENVLLLLLGFWQQWRFPDSYPKLVNISKVRADNVQRLKKRLSSNLKQLITTLGFDPEQIDKNIDEILNRANSFEVDTATSSGKSGPDITNFKQNVAKKQAAVSLSQSSDLFALRTIIGNSNDPTLSMGLYDLLSFDLIEAASITGWRNSAAMCQTTNQTCAQYAYGNSNEIVNELIFDLRPVTTSGGINDEPYTTEPDDTGINKDGIPHTVFEATVPGVKYVPSVVFREYPFSTSESVDLSKVFIFPPEISVNSGNFGIITTTSVTPGIARLGPIFAVKPNVAGRHTYEYDKIINPDPDKFPDGTKAKKHIDVCVIENTDVTGSSLGRSDEDIVNLFQIFPRVPGCQAEVWRGVMANFMPILNQISLVKHGLRNREVTTDFAFYADASKGGVAHATLARWATLMDHWYQHNSEYLSGTITLRAMPELRVGYRLDWKDRHESYYVESVSHSWQYPNAMTTSVEVSRGQRNDPFPQYIPPVFTNPDGVVLRESSGDRSIDGRLAREMPFQDTQATVRAVDRGDPTVDDGPNTVDIVLPLTSVAVPAFINSEQLSTKLNPFKTSSK